MYILHSTCTYCTVHVHTAQYMHSTYILHSTCSCTIFTSRYQELSVSSDNIYTPRNCTSISELGSYQLPYGEFDTVGVVMSVTSSSSSGREDRSVGGAGVVTIGTLTSPSCDSRTPSKKVDSVHLADAAGNILVISVWNGLEVRCTFVLHHVMSNHPSYTSSPPPPPTLPLLPLLHFPSSPSYTSPPPPPTPPSSPYSPYSPPLLHLLPLISLKACRMWWCQGLWWVCPT